MRAMERLKSEIFKAIADNTRLRIINLLLSTDEALCVCELVGALRLPQYQVSKHIGILKNTGLVRAEKKGTWVYYSLASGPVNLRLFNFLREFLDDSVFRMDSHALMVRLKLREDGNCVVGFVPEEEIVELLKNKGVKIQT